LRVIVDTDEKRYVRAFLTIESISSSPVHQPNAVRLLPSVISASLQMFSRE
jgi:hypothetical protein